MTPTPWNQLEAAAYLTDHAALSPHNRVPPGGGRPEPLVSVVMRTHLLFTFIDVPTVLFVWVTTVIAGLARTDESTNCVGAIRVVGTGVAQHTFIDIFACHVDWVRTSVSSFTATLICSPTVEAFGVFRTEHLLGIAFINVCAWMVSGIHAG